jgi:putative redox protein
MVDIDITYEGGLRCRPTHRPSGAAFTTDAPVDNNGRGESFSPTDLVATGLGTCMITVMGIAARKRGLDLEGTRVHVKKVMTSSPPRRIARLEVDLAIPEGVAARFDEQARKELEHAAHTCPVRLSVLDAIEVPVAFPWGA